MDKKKKIIIISAISAAVLAVIIAAIILLVSFFDFGGKKPNDNDVSSGYAQQDGDAVFTVGSAEGAKGDIVKVPVKISNNPGFIASLMSFKYDNKVLEYIGYEKGDFLEDYEFSNKDGVLKFLGLEEEDVSDNGLLFNLKFEIAADSGEFDIKLEIEDVINYDEQIIRTAVENGKITVK